MNKDTIASNISRLVGTDETSELASLYTGVLSIPRSLFVDASVVVQGEDEVCRVIGAVRDWEEKVSKAKHLFIVGDNWKATGKNRPSQGKSEPDITQESIQKPPFNLRRTEGVVIGDFSANSVTAAELTLEQMQKLGVQSFELHVSQYHIVRMYLTMVKTMLKVNKCLAIIPVPTPTSMDTVTPLSGATAWELVAGEVERIKKYQKEPYQSVATLLELKEYLSWLWEQPVLKHYKDRTF